MGADLYITPLNAQQRQQWEPEFEKAASARDEALDEASQKVAQVRVEQAYEQMYSRGYFRDPYNDWDLLWNFGLSWWQDVIPMLDKEGWLSVERAQGLLAIWREQYNNERPHGALGYLTPAAFAESCRPRAGPASATLRPVRHADDGETSLASVAR